MKKNLLYKKALYRELRSFVGYFDARRIIRSIDNSSEKLNDDALTKLLYELGFDNKCTETVVEIAQKHSYLMNAE